MSFRLTQIGAKEAKSKALSPPGISRFLAIATYRSEVALEVKLILKESEIIASTRESQFGTHDMLLCSFCVPDAIHFE